MSALLSRALTFSGAILFLVSSSVYAYEKDFSQTVPLQPGERLTLKTFKGSIHMTSWERSEVFISALITAPSDEDSAYSQAAVEATRIEVRRSGNGLLVRSDYDEVPTRGWLNRSRTLPEVHYEIKAPRQAEIELDDYKSEIELYEFSGRVRVETYKGTVRAGDLSGGVQLDTYKGKAELSAIRGSVDIETFKGEVTVRATEIDDTSRIETYKGHVELAISEGQGLSVRADLGKRGRLGGEWMDPSQERTRGRSEGIVEHEINQGGPRLKVSTYKGEVRLTRW